jgi:enoyl-CoA hydratase
MPEVLFDMDDAGIGTITLNRPEVRNGLNWSAMQSFAETVEQAHGRPDLRVLIVTGAGTAFASGGDIAELQNYPSRADGQRLTTIMGDALCRLENLPCPTIAAINGPARGGGAEISLACDMRVIAEDADIGFVQARLGIVTAWGGGQRLLRAIGYSRALELMVTGRILRAAEALHLRLVTAMAPAGEALASARALAAQIAANPPAATAAAKRLLRASLTHADGLAFEAERAEFPALWDTEFRREAVRKFLGREK